MLGVLVLLNGMPGSGKSFLGPALARHLGMPRLGKDDIKEALWDAHRLPDEADPLEWSRRLGGVAFDVLWRLAPTLGASLMLEAPFVDFHAGPLRHLHPAPIEIYLTATPEVIHRRYQERQPRRHECHRFHPLPELDEVVEFAAKAAPLDLGGPLLHVDTTHGSDPAELAEWVRSQVGSADLDVVSRGTL